MKVVGNGNVSGAVFGENITLVGNAAIDYDVNLKSKEDGGTMSIGRWRELRGTSECLDFSSTSDLASAISRFESLPRLSSLNALTCSEFGGISAPLMANTKSAQKNNRKTIARTLHNRSRKSRLKTLAKKVEALAAGDDKEALKVAAGQYVSAMDRAAKTHLVHNNKANRTKAAMAKLIAA